VLAFDKALERIKLEGHDNHDIDLYIERRISFLHSRIDLQATKDGLLLLEKCIMRFDKESNSPLGKALSSHVDKRLARIMDKLARVTGRDHARKTRSIEFIGDLWSDLFGNPGPSDWKQINSNIIALKEAIKKTDENSNIDHSDIDSNRHAIEKQSSDIREIIAIVSKNRAELTTVDSDIGFLKSYVEIITLADAVQTQVEFLVEVKVDSLKGFCNDHALSKDFLVDNLLSLEANKVGLGPIFGSWEWREYYKNRMCTVAFDKGDLWVTLRIPIVKKAEKMVRVIPSPQLNEVVKKASNFGLVVTLFKESVNEKYLAMTQSSFELCNNLGTTRTCGVRETKFSISHPVVMPVEFALNRFLILSANPASFKVMSKCPNGITEHLIRTDSVWLVPNNCSYSSNHLSIDVREADVAITKEIGLVHFDQFEVSQVSSKLANSSNLVAEIYKLSNGSKQSVFEKNRNEIHAKLDSIKTDHESLSTRYSLEKWIMVAAVVVLAVLFLMSQLHSLLKAKKQRAITDIEMNMQSSNLKAITFSQSNQQQQHLSIEHETSSQQQQRQLQQQQQRQITNRQADNPDVAGNAAPNNYSEIAEVGNVSFSSRPEHSQFYSSN